MAGSNVKITNCNVRSNQACNGGGGLAFRSSYAEVRECRVCNNRSTLAYGQSSGGGIYIQTARGIIVSRTVIDNNGCNNNGGGIFVNAVNSNPVQNCRIENCVVTNNKAGEYGIGIATTNNDLLVTNTILTLNQDTTLTGNVSYGVKAANCVMTVRYSAFYANADSRDYPSGSSEVSIGSGVIIRDPMFLGGPPS